MKTGRQNGHDACPISHENRHRQKHRVKTMPVDPAKIRDWGRGRGRYHRRSKHRKMSPAEFVVSICRSRAADKKQDTSQTARNESDSIRGLAGPAEFSLKIVLDWGSGHGFDLLFPGCCPYADGLAT